MSISYELSSAVALRDEAMHYLLEAANLIEKHEGLKGEANLIDEMTLMMSGFSGYAADDFEGIFKDAIDLFNCVIDYVKFLKHKINQ